MHSSVGYYKGIKRHIFSTPQARSWHHGPGEAWLKEPLILIELDSAWHGRLVQTTTRHKCVCRTPTTTFNFEFVVFCVVMVV